MATDAKTTTTTIPVRLNLLIRIDPAKWTADHHPADWREQLQRWDRLHYPRVAIIVAAFVLTLVAGILA